MTNHSPLPMAPVIVGLDKQRKGIFPHTHTHLFQLPVRYHSVGSFHISSTDFLMLISY